MQRQREGCANSVGWTLKRALLLGLGMALFGERKRLVRKALAGSIAVQTFVMAWAATNPPGDASLPSGAAVLTNNAASILSTYLLRSAIVGTGLIIAGEKRNLVRNAFAGTAAIEASVLVWAAGYRAANDSLTVNNQAPAVAPSPALPHAPPELPTLVP